MASSWLLPRRAVNPARNRQYLEKHHKSALDGLKMALKLLKTHEFGRNPDHLPENRKNQRKWMELALIQPAKHSSAALNLLKAFLMRTCVPINANGLFVCKVTSFMK